MCLPHASASYQVGCGISRGVWATTTRIASVLALVGGCMGAASVGIGAAGTIAPLSWPKAGYTRS